LGCPASDQVLAMDDSSAHDKLAYDMIDVHGQQAATVARENARAAALAGQAEKAKSWIRVLGAIQRQQAGNVSAIRTLPQ
jgi:hypothetical protein